MDAYVVVEVVSPPAALLKAIGELRVAVWRDEEKALADSAADSCWLDEFDGLPAPTCRHWIVRNRSEPCSVCLLATSRPDTEASAEFASPSPECTCTIVAAARLTWHATPDQHRDVRLWIDAGRDLPFPCVDMGRLVVRLAHRRRGIAQALNRARIDAARAAGARACVVTASAGNAKLLAAIGFEDIGVAVRFADRPAIPFYAMQLLLLGEDNAPDDTNEACSNTGYSGVKAVSPPHDSLGRTC